MPDETPKCLDNIVLYRSLMLCRFPWRISSLGSAVLVSLSVRRPTSCRRHLCDPFMWWPLTSTQQATATLGLGATASLGIGASLEPGASAAGMESQVGASLLVEKQDGSLGGEVTATMDILAGLDTAAQVRDST